MLLNFGAVDYEATVYVNGNKIGFNRGGYFRFEIDVTDHISFNETNELYVFSLIASSICTDPVPGLCLYMILQIAATMSSRSASRHCASLIYFTGPAVASGRVFGSRLPQKITSLSLILMRTWMDKVSSGAAHLVHQLTAA